jgi:hypothetical protein
MSKTLYGNQLGSETLRAGKVLTISVDAGGGAIVEQFNDGRKIAGSDITASTAFGPFVDDTVLKVSAKAGATVTIGDPVDQVAQRPTDSKAAAVDSLVSDAGIGPLSIAAPDGTERGDTLTATPNAGWTVASYQWTRDGVDISGETSSTYTLTLADEGALIGCRAGSPVFTSRLEIPAGTYPTGYLSLNGGVLSLGSGVLSLV